MVGPFEHDDPGHRADPSFPNLLKKATNVVQLSPHCGTELKGVQIVRIYAIIISIGRANTIANLVGAFNRGPRRTRAHGGRPRMSSIPGPDLHGSGIRGAEENCLVSQS